MFDALVIVSQHGVDHVGVAVRLNQRKERMLGAKSVPKRVNGVVRESLGAMDVVVQAAVLPGHVFVEIRRVEAMIQSGVERFLVLPRADDLNLAQFALPFRPGFAANAIEVPIGDFGIEVLHGVGGADGRDAHLDQDLLVLACLVLGEEAEVGAGGFATAAETVGVVNDRFSVAIDGEVVKRPRVFRREIERPIRSPAAGEMKTRDRVKSRWSPACSRRELATTPLCRARG